MTAAAAGHPNDGVPEESCDVFVLGGGPGGSATATHLARAGLDVVLAERERHPRFHIGESLLPRSLPLLEELGVLDEVRRIGVKKRGAEFVSADGGKEAVFDFSRALTGGPDHAFQVLREDFDTILFRRAGTAGARLLEETQARILSLAPDGALVETLDGAGTARRYRAAFLVDASGRSNLTARLRGDWQRDPNCNSAAIFGHFRGVPRADGPRGGNIRIILTEPGWLWQIPLQNGTTSVGLVVPGPLLAKHDGGPEDFFAAHCARHPAARQLLEKAEPVAPLRTTGNFSYRSATAGDAAHIKVGDAYGFIDPIFSTGVHLALGSALAANKAILAARAEPAARDRIFARYDGMMRGRLDYLSWFIYNIQSPTFRNMMLNPKDFLGLERAVVAVLAGDPGNAPRLRWRIGLFKLIWFVSRIRDARREREHA